MTDPTIPPQDSDAPIFDTLCRAADLAVNAGLAYARADDPHRFATLAQEFDNGRAARRLVLEYRAAGQVRVVLRLDGYKHGEPNTVEVFSTTLQGKGGHDAAAAH